MSDWTIRIPHRSRNDSVVDAADAVRTFEDREERAVTRNVLAELATTYGARTVGDALDLLERAGPEARRALLDRARGEEGLPSAEVADARRELEAVNTALPHGSGPLRDPSGYLMSPICAAPDCMTVPRERTKARRWWCPAHRAGHEDDLKDHTGARLGYSASGLVIDLDEQEREIAREREREKSRRAAREAREAEQGVAAAQAVEDRRGERERLRSEAPDDFFRAQMGDG